VIGAHILPFGKEPDTIAASGIIPDEGDNAGVLAVGMTLTFTDNKSTDDDERGEDDNPTSSSNTSGGGPPGGRSIASGLVGYLAESSEETLYAGKKGRIKILGPAHCPTSAILIRKSGGRGNGDTTNSTADRQITAVEFPLPKSIPEIEESGGIRMPNSMGFIYEAEAVRRLIAADCLTFPQWTPQESIWTIRTIENVLKQIRME